MYYLGKRTVTNDTIKEMQGLLDIAKKNPNILTKLREKKYTVKDTDKTFRIINYWESVGLLDNNRESSSLAWRRFSMMDVIFIHLLTKLREFDLSIQKLKVTKQDLEKTLTIGKAKTDISGLEYAYMRAVGLKDRGNTYFMLTPEGHIDCVTQKDILLMQALEEMPEGYICINFNQLLSSHIKLGKDSIPVYTENAYVLNKKEKAILEGLRNKEYKSITIVHKNGGESMSVEYTSDYKEGDALPDYGDLIIKVQDGIVVQKQIKEKIKVK